MGPTTSPHKSLSIAALLSKMVEFKGTYKRTEEKDYEAFLKKLGLGLMMRKAATASTPTMIITEEGGKWKMVTATTLKSIELSFELGVPFKETTTDGRECNTTVTMAGNKEVKVIREFSDAGIDVQFICEDVTSVQHF